MSDSEGAAIDMDLLAASLRADASDLGAFVESLAAKLEAVIPGKVSVQRSRRGMLGPKFVRRIAVEAGGERLELVRGQGNSIETTCSRLSGGIVLKREAIDTNAWLAALGAALATEAQRSRQTRQALERLHITEDDTMGFFNRDDDARPQNAEEVVAVENQQPEQAPHAATYESGSVAGIPESGRHRIERMKQEVGRGFFTSDLSINEFLLVNQAGFEPLGLVLGSSIYHIGFQQANWSQNQEMGVLTQAMYHARELAMTRMEEEADQLGADGVVGVRLDIGRYEWGAELAEFIAVGTAVKHRGGELHRAANGRPFTSDLTGQDFSTLLRSGYRPVGMVMGNCVYHVAHQGLRAAWRQIGRNQEMTNYTQALYEARELAMERMQTEADELQAGGIVGARINQKSHGWGSHVIEFFAIGTAVVATSAEHVIEKPALVLPLTG